MTIKTTSIGAGFFMVFLLCDALVTFVLLDREAIAKSGESASVPAAKQEVT